MHRMPWPWTSEPAYEEEDSASDRDGDECAAAESDEEIVNETILQSPMKIQTRCKSYQVILPEAFQVTCSDSEDEPPRP